MVVNTNDISSLEQLLIERLASYRDIICPNSPDVYSEILDGAIRTALTLIGRTDALYHDVEHTCLVTLCGQDMFLGRELRRGDLSHSDWLHFTIACLFHDIGYVRGILDQDDEKGQLIGADGEQIELPSECTDASLTPYHVFRGQQFVRDRNWHPDVDVSYLAGLISQTEFPVPASRNMPGVNDKNFGELAQLIQSADLVGQLADPNYIKKIPALYYEFFETGAATRLGYTSAYDLASSYPSLFANSKVGRLDTFTNYKKTENDYFPPTYGISVNQIKKPRCLRTLQCLHHSVLGRVCQAGFGKIVNHIGLKMSRLTQIFQGQNMQKILVFAAD